MTEQDIAGLKTTPALATSCKHFKANFCNIWSDDRHISDLRVVLTLLLRIHLAKRDF